MKLGGGDIKFGGPSIEAMKNGDPALMKSGGPEPK